MVFFDGRVFVVLAAMMPSSASPHRYPRRAVGCWSRCCGQIEELQEAHPLSKVLTSIPGIDVRIGARILIEVGDGSTFPTAGHLAAYAGLAPRPGARAPRSAAKPSRRGNKQLKRTYFLSAFAALGDSASRAYCDKKIAQGKHHTQDLLCPARRRADVLFAMLRDGTFHSSQPTAAR
ncbi:transposase [Streptomyces anulatus]|uniref:transposase n=1 Tax=Streptomyces anulatus TaxID=1892 RepID=UPI003D9F5508